jgi:anti-sigma factor (TIGR02949 family)
MAKKKLTCQSFLDDLSDYIDGDVAEEIRVTFEAHLAKCPNCWVVFDETQRTVEIVQRFDCHPIPDKVKDRLMQTLSAKLKNA